MECESGTSSPQTCCATPTNDISHERSTIPVPESPPSSVSSSSPSSVSTNSTTENKEAVIQYARREGFLDPTRESELREEFTKPKKTKTQTFHTQLVSNTQTSIGTQEQSLRWIEGYWAFGRYMKRLANDAHSRRTFHSAGQRYCPALTKL